LQHVSRERYSCDAREHEGIGFGTREATEVISNSLNEELWNGNRAPPGDCLRFLYQGLSPHCDRSTLFDAKRSVCQIDVLSPKSKKFRATKLAPCCEQNDESQVFRHRRFQCFDFTERRHRSFRGPFHSPAGDFAGRRDEEAVGDGRPQDR